MAKQRGRRCDCCDLILESCGKNREAATKQADLLHKAKLRANGAFEAQYSGTCGNCWEPFNVGSMIKRVKLEISTSTYTFYADCCL